MKLRTVQRIAFAMLGVFCIFMLLNGITRELVFGLCAIADLVVFGIFTITYWRCPKCGECLGPIAGKHFYCRKCGTKINI